MVSYDVDDYFEQNFYSILVNSKLYLCRTQILKISLKSSHFLHARTEVNELGITNDRGPSLSNLTVIYSKNAHLRHAPAWQMQKVKFCRRVVVMFRF